MKRTIKLTENDLHKIVNRVVESTINEGKNGTTYEELQNIRQTLSEIMDSGWIPFSSPSPSSTEVKIKNSIIEAARNIDAALYYCGQCGYNQPMVNVV